MLSIFVFARALLLAAASAAASGAGTQPAQPDPALATAAVPPFRYTSAFTGYRPFSDEAMTPWRQANDTAAGIGGWRVYAREVRQPSPTVTTTPTAPTAPVAPAAPSASAAHGAHGSR